MREGKGGKKMEKIRKKELGKGKKGRGRNKEVREGGRRRKNKRKGGGSKRGDIILNIN